MVDPRAFDLHRTLAARGFARDYTFAKGNRYAGAIRAQGRDVRVALTFVDLEFVTLPTLSLVDAAQDCPEAVAHLNRNSELCYARNEEFVLDRYDVGGSICSCLDAAQRALSSIAGGADLSAEIAREFPQHWLGGTVHVDYRGSASGPAFLYEIPRPHGTPSLLQLSPEESPRKTFGLSASVARRVVAERRPAFVARTAERLTFRRGFRQPATVEEFFEWAEGCEAGLACSLTQAAVVPYPELAALFVFGPNGCVGAELNVPRTICEKLQRPIALRRYLTGAGRRAPIVRLTGARMDPEFVLSRNIGRPSPFLGKRFAIAGCGTIGGHLAKFLVQSGAGQGGGSLLLYDDQTLTPGNIGRHLLGPACLGMPKASALREELLRVYPEANIVSVTRDVVRDLESLANVDLIIDATGEEAVSTSINEFNVMRRRRGGRGAVLHVWLFGRGDAAQAILVELDVNACYRCLRPDRAAPWRFSPLRPGYEPAFAMGTCGEGMFMEYGVGAPVIAASLGLQMALDWSGGGLRHSFRTIAIDPVSTRQVKAQNASRHERCPACSSAPNGAGHRVGAGSGVPAI